jgi:hypothetical protein
LVAFDDTSFGYALANFQAMFWDVPLRPVATQRCAASVSERDGSPQDLTKDLTKTVDMRQPRPLADNHHDVTRLKMPSHGAGDVLKAAAFEQAMRVCDGMTPPLK